MDNEDFNLQCNDINREYHLLIPCRLAERVEAFASNNNTSLTGVVIEALDKFLREQKNV